MVFDADKIFMFDTDKHYFASKLMTDMWVYIGPTYTKYVGIYTNVVTVLPVQHVGTTSHQHVGPMEAQGAS